MMRKGNRPGSEISHAESGFKFTHTHTNTVNYEGRKERLKGKGGESDRTVDQM